MTRHVMTATELQPRDVLLNSEGEPALVWSTGQPKKVLSVEHVVRVTFDDHRHAEFVADHVLDVERAQ